MGMRAGLFRNGEFFFVKASENSNAPQQTIKKVIASVAKHGKYSLHVLLNVADTMASKNALNDPLRASFSGFKEIENPEITKNKNTLTCPLYINLRIGS
jgi:hypothetical protein